MPPKGWRKYGATAKASDTRSGPDLDITSVRRRLHEAIPQPEVLDSIDDWEEHDFGSTRVASASYSPARRQLIVNWTNGYVPYIYDGVPPAIWTAFTETGSAGRFVNDHLNTWPYRPMSDV